MRLFKHGDALAIVLPESVVKATASKDGDEFDFVEVRKGFYALVSRKEVKEQAKQAAEIVLPKEKFVQQPKASPAVRKSNSTASLLEKHGFIVFQDEEQAKALSMELENEIKFGDIKGVRGFDKKYYVVTRDYLESNSQKILKFLKEKDALLGDIISQTKLDADGVQSLLYVLKDEGEVIEKKRGFYSLVK